MSSKNIGPYTIEKRLGVGGMGEVFKAYDERLGRSVAIKRIRPDKEGTDDNRERLRREARAVAKLNHSAIVQVYDIFQDGQSDCIVMEFVEGQTLDALLADGPLDALRAAVLGHEIAEGLAEAHTKDVIHRDLKTENIIVTPSGRAKILDFGLAKPISADGLDPVLTGKGQLVGTSRAMSPEYVGGGAVDPRADLFSLGVLLYESVVGKSPFRAQNTLATLKQVILHQQTPAAEANPNVPIELSDLIERLLQKEPDNRPDSAHVVALELGRIVGQLSSGTIDLPSSNIHLRQSGSQSGLTAASGSSILSATLELPRPRRRWPLWLTLTAIVLVVVGLFVWRQTISPNPTLGPGADPIAIVVGEFVNETDNPYYGEGLETAFRSGLEQSSFIRALPKPRIEDAKKRMVLQLPENAELNLSQWAEISQREGAKFLVIGEIIGPSESNLQIIGRVINPTTSEAAFVHAQNTNSDDVLEDLTVVVNQIRRWLGESGTDIANTKKLEKVTTSNLQALLAYTRAVEKIQQYQHGEAIPLLIQALELDPDFAMANAKLGVSYHFLRKPADALKHFSQALENEDRLTDIESLYVKAWKAFIDQKQDEVIHNWTVMTQLYPENPDGHRNMGLTYMLILFDYPKAVDALSKAATLLTDSGGDYATLLQTLQYLTLAQLALNRYDEALETLSKLEQLQPESDSRAPEALPYLVTIYLAQGDHQKAMAPINTALDGSLDSQTRMLFLQLLAYISADQGGVTTAAAFLSEAIRLASDNREPIAELQNLMDKAASLELSSNQGEFNAVMTEIMPRIRNVPQTGDTLTQLTPTLAYAGKLYARNGLIEEAQEIYDLIEGPGSLGFDHGKSAMVLLNSEILAAKGNLEEAIQSAEAAAALLDNFEVRETLARLNAQAGNLDSAIRHYQWIRKERGRTFSECVDVCPSGLRLIAWNMAFYHLGRLHEEKGDIENAYSSYTLFLQKWEDDDIEGNEDSLEPVTIARKQLDQLNEVRSTAEESPS